MQNSYSYSEGQKYVHLMSATTTPCHVTYAKGILLEINNDAICDTTTTRWLSEEIMSWNNSADIMSVGVTNVNIDVSYWCDGIICDYNYVFDPDASLKRYFGNGAEEVIMCFLWMKHMLVNETEEILLSVLKKEDFLA